MKKLVLGFAFITMVFNAKLQAQEGVGGTTASALPVLSLVLTSQMLDCGSRLATMNCASAKVIIESKDDALEFIATDGAVRSAKLQTAFEIVRKSNPEIKASDIQMALAIIDQQ